MKALREAITNAVMHRDWFIEGANVFVEIYTDRIEVVSPGGLPRGMTLADLGRKSVRRNALIADLLHRIDFIEKAGTGIKRIRDEARDGGYPEPVWEADGFVTTIFRPNPEVRVMAAKRGREVTEQVTAHVPHMYRTSLQQVALLEFAREPRSREQLQKLAGIRHRQHFLLEYLRPLLDAGLLELTIPDKPRSSRQRYLLTRVGIEYLKKRMQEE
jgi:ATP-dependent DNA helicase RecG